jgi:hypothetical protein
MHRPGAGNMRGAMNRSVSSNSVRDLVCARCGAAFTCGSGGKDGRCWCADEDFRLPMPPAADQDCLCPSCLRAHAERLGVEAGR